MTLAHCVVLAAAAAIALAAHAPGELYTPLVAQKYLATAINTSSTEQRYPEYTDSEEGIWQNFNASQWTSGFFPSALYQLNTRKSLCAHSSFDQSTDWLGLGRDSAAGILPYLDENENEWQHDLGFVSFPFQDELELNSTNVTTMNIINTFADKLAKRFNWVVGCTRSWDTADPTDFQVIIDNMMNLNLLFISANLTGNDTLQEMAISHADHTLENHVRPDGSSFHVVDYNSTTGDVISRHTAQGYADNSTWTRGQAWGIYGFATMYQNTGLERFLITSRRMATFFKNAMPEEGIVPWDFDAPVPRPADSSAATASAVGLLLLSRLENSLTPPNATGAQLWQDFAISLLDANTKLAWRPDWQSVLANGTVNGHQVPPNERTGTVYGDYYFVKAGNDLISMELANC